MFQIIGGVSVIIKVLLENEIYESNIFLSFFNYQKENGFTLFWIIIIQLDWRELFNFFPFTSFFLVKVYLFQGYYKNIEVRPLSN